MECNVTADQDHFFSIVVYNAWDKLFEEPVEKHLLRNKKGA